MRTALFIHAGHRLFPDVLRLVELLGPVDVFDCDNGASEAKIADAKPDAVFNFITRCVFRGPVLALPNMNFHPAPPNYPGIGGVSRALFDRAPYFGTTAHRMVRKIDAGEIYVTEQFVISSLDTPESLFAKAEISCVGLVEWIAEYILKNGKFPPPVAQWSGRYMSIREFHHEWLRLDPNEPEIMERKLRAATHSKHSGPYVMINGHRFVLAKDKLPGHPVTEGRENSSSATSATGKAAS